MKKPKKGGGSRPPSYMAKEIPVHPIDSKFKPYVAGYFRGFRRGDRYPVWRYHESLQPRMVHDTSEDNVASLAGWKEVNIPMTAVPKMVNWRYDLEDFSGRQLVAFAKDEFDVDLPEEAGKEKLFKLIWTLTMAAPVNKDRVVLMAQTMKMEYEATQEEIKRKIADEKGEVIREEFEA